MPENRVREEMPPSYSPELAKEFCGQPRGHAVTHLGPRDSCWLRALTPRGDDSRRSENIVHCEVMILEERFSYVNDLFKQTWVKELMGHTAPGMRTALHCPVDVRCSP